MQNVYLKKTFVQSLNLNYVWKMRNWSIIDISVELESLTLRANLTLPLSIQQCIIAVHSSIDIGCIA